MSNYFEIDFLAVETKKSGDAITIHYSIDGEVTIHVVDGGYIDTGKSIHEHISKYYDNASHIDHVVLTHQDQDHANGLRYILENCSVGKLWMHRPWLYADEIIDRFETYNSVDALKRRLKQCYAAVAELERIAEEKDIEILEPFQGSRIGAFTVLAPTKTRYLDLLVSSDKTPEQVEEAKSESFLDQAIAIAADIKNLFLAAWGDEAFPVSGTSNENEMSVIQYAHLNGKNILLTGDAGRDALNEAADYAPIVGLHLPGLDCIQVPHHGGRHNVSTEILDRFVGARLTEPVSSFSCLAVCSSAKADTAHPRKVVKRAFIHRGAQFNATEGRSIRYSDGIARPDWTPLVPDEYPNEMEEA